jgi:hypothetical protein
MLLITATYCFVELIVENRRKCPTLHAVILFGSMPGNISSSHGRGTFGPYRQMVNVNYSSQISSVLLTRFRERHYYWTSKCHMDMTRYGMWLDLPLRDKRK